MFPSALPQQARDRSGHFASASRSRSVAGNGIAPLSSGYEPDNLLLVHPAAVLLVYNFSMNLARAKMLGSVK